MSDKQTKVLRLIGDVMEVPVGSLDENTSATSISNWDSLNQMNLVLALEEEFECRFTDEQIVGLINVKAIMDSLPE